MAMKESIQFPDSSNVASGCVTGTLFTANLL